MRLDVSAKFCKFAIACLFCAPSGLAQCSGHAELNKWERGQFVGAAAGNRNEVFAEVLSAAGCGKQMVNALTRQGAKIEVADKTSGFALITVVREKLLDVLDIAGIAYAYINDADWAYTQYDPAARIPQRERKTEPVPAFTIPNARVATSLPRNGPYFEASAIGLSELWKQHPEADGRGIRVGVLEKGFDLLHPELREARDAAGNLVPKVADLSTVTSPDDDSGWVRFGEPIQVKNGTFEASGRAWTVPEGNTYRFGIFRKDLSLGYFLDPRAKKLSLSVGVLWNEQSNLVWVDTDGDGNFKNERALGDYGMTHDFAWFGKKDDNEDNRIPFGVKIDHAESAVYIEIGEAHGAAISGSLAGNKLTGGLYDGAAPNAQLVDSSSLTTILPAVVSIFARRDVDVINRSGRIGGQLDGQQEGSEDFDQRVLERMIAVYNKPIVVYSAAAGTIHVMDYAGPEMLRRNRQIGPPYQDTINSGVWFLPSGVVNTVLAPSANIGTESRYMPYELLDADGIRSFEDQRRPGAPEGYGIGSNPSPTIPIVSGILADLISEARREHIRYNAIRLNNAVFTGTRLLDGFPLSQQGYGLVNASQSWDQLTKMAGADDPANPELTSFTISRIEDGHNIEVQGFHADLPSVGENLEGEIWITRHGGYAGGRKYTFALRGNNGSYELLEHEANLERDKPVRVRFRTNGAPGWNIVFLELKDVKAHVVMQDVPLSVRVPDVPEKIGPGVARYESTIPPLHSERRYVHVGNEVQAARYVMCIPYTGPESISTRTFPDFRYEDKGVPSGEALNTAHNVGPMETLESLVVNDEPGTQEIFWENRGRPEYATVYDGPSPDVPIHGELTVSKYAVKIEKLSNGVLTVTDKLADVEGRVELFGAKLAVSVMKGQRNHAMTEVKRDVPAELAEWRVRITGSVKSAHADAYLFDCTGKNGCSIVSQQEITDNGALLVVDKPQAGTWKIVVRSREQVSEEPTYRLTESQLTRTRGQASEADIKHSSGETWILDIPSTARYAAFRIAGTPGVESEKNGLLIAMTPLEGNTP